MRIGPLAVGVHVTSDSLQDQVKDRYAHALVPDTPHVVLRVTLTHAKQYVDFARVPVQVQGHCFTWEHEMCSLTVDAKAGWGEINGMSAHPLAVLEYALRCLVALTAWRHDAHLIHASGVGVGDKAVLFIGPSGAGKSTLARLRPARLPLLADDLVLGQFTDSGWQAWPTPFSGEAPPEIQTPRTIGLVCVPVRATEIRLRPLPPNAVLSYMLQSLPLITYYREAMASLLPQLREVLTHTPALVLYFPRIPHVWDYLLKRLDSNARGAL